MSWLNWLKGCCSFIPHNNQIDTSKTLFFCEASPNCVLMQHLAQKFGISTPSCTADNNSNTSMHWVPKCITYSMYSLESSALLCGAGKLISNGDYNSGRSVNQRLNLTQRAVDFLKLWNLLSMSCLIHCRRIKLRLYMLNFNSSSCSSSSSCPEWHENWTKIFAAAIKLFYSFGLQRPWSSHATFLLILKKSDLLLLSIASK